ncbi:hypothetical protein AVEN_117544-1 [Araneus ventricosus]|uniref:Histone-lysine N-methyltransferase SETMAR n=1 Tax=Araneus ventricosus TaxID=182803 RepID=A0A4Y2RPB8_ARAVE|nr:hypothetical protein AVEN_117544-1 [Araneus ventricosus]
MLQVIVPRWTGCTRQFAGNDRDCSRKVSCLLHDNARPHTALVTRDLVQRFRWNVLEQPPYSPDLSPSDFHLFGPLKKHLAGRHFRTNAEV